MSDYVFTTLSAYSGSANDRKKKHLVAIYSYDVSMSLSDMEHKTLRDLGYTGSLGDMWKRYLVFLGGTGTVADNLKAYFNSSFYKEAGPSSGDGMFHETSDFIILENGDFLLLE